jgi:pimeloyl-ACP methyl ester carboxylesterase
MKTLLSLVASLVVAYLLLLAFYALKQRSLIYYPSTIDREQAHQQASMLGGEPWLSASGEWIGWFLPVDPGAGGAAPNRAVVFHGNAGMALNRDYYARLLSGFSRSGPWEVYVFEYPAYGPRSGELGEEAFLAAAERAADELLENQSAPLLIIGESIGSGVAAGLASRRPESVAALMLITPFDSLVHLANHHFPYLPAGLVLKDRFDNVQALEGFDRPLVVVTAGRDTIVPANFAEPLLQQHSGPLHHEVQIDAGHNTLSFDPNEPSWRAVDAFLAEAID